MKNLLLALSLLMSVTMLSCGKTQDTGCTPVPVASEKDAMVKFCTDNGITYTEHSSGLLYQIMNPGTGATLDVNSYVEAYYTGKFLSGVVFQSNTNQPLAAGFSLNQVIEGWKIGIPLIRRGGRIRLIIPSALAYSCVGRENIPPNTPLYFEVAVN
jgi:FKBP-type peptidyl-prolyl cis-trans isomerase